MPTVEIDRRTYNLLRKLFSDARRLLVNAKRSDGDDKIRIVGAEDLRRLSETLEQMLEERENEHVRK